MRLIVKPGLVCRPLLDGWLSEWPLIHTVGLRLAGLGGCLQLRSFVVRTKLGLTLFVCLSTGVYTTQGECQD